VSVIPHTLAVTNLGRLTPGDQINLEADLFGKYVERMQAGRASQTG
jgi:riboflavin synthase